MQAVIPTEAFTKTVETIRKEAESKQKQKEQAEKDVEKSQKQETRQSKPKDQKPDNTPETAKQGNQNHDHEQWGSNNAPSAYAFRSCSRHVSLNVTVPCAGAPVTTTDILRVYSRIPVLGRISMRSDRQKKSIHHCCGHRNLFRYC